MLGYHTPVPLPSTQPTPPGPAVCLPGKKVHSGAGAVAGIDVYGLVSDCSCFSRLAGALYHLLLFGIQLHITLWSFWGLLLRLCSCPLRSLSRTLSALWGF